MPLHLSSGKEREATLGPWPSFLWPSSVIQSQQLADRGEGVSQEACFRSIQLTSSPRLLQGQKNEGLPGSPRGLAFGGWE